MNKIEKIARLKSGYYSIVFLISISISCVHAYSQTELQYPVEFDFVDINCQTKKGGIFIIENRKDLVGCCQNIVMADIDFKENILVGIREASGGCRKPKIDIEVLYSPELKTIDCLVAIKQFGACRRLFPVVFWFEIKKPINNPTINVNIKKISSK